MNFPTNAELTADEARKSRVARVCAVSASSNIERAIASLRANNATEAMYFVMEAKRNIQGAIK